VHNRKVKYKAIDTQAIFTEATPAFDLAIPEPDIPFDDEDEDGESESSFVATTLKATSKPTTSTKPLPTQPRISEEQVFAQVEMWLDAQQRRGVPSAHCLTALKAGSYDPAVADIVLQYLLRHGRVQKDIMGIWTESDDECLQARDARKIGAMERKHGSAGVNARFQLLDFMGS
jgi:hypothetical protein